MFFQKINPNVEAKLSYLVKFVQESIEEDTPSGKATFTMIEVKAVRSFKYSVIELTKLFFIAKFFKCLRFLVILIISQIIALNCKSGCGTVPLDK